MLTSLQIRNFALIEEQSVQFGSGLNVISGETGSGKSILLEAIKLILGGRGSADLIRSGSESLEVSATFDLSTHSLEQKAALPDLIAMEQELVVTRELNSAGKNKVFINGRTATVTLLKEIAEKLINICGQNQSLKLFETNYHRNLIDVYGAHQQLIKKYVDSYRAWSALKQQIHEAENSSRESILKRQGLESLVEEIEAINLRQGLRNDIENEVRRLSSAQALIASCQEVNDEFEKDEGLSSQLKNTYQTLQSLCKLDPSLVKLRDMFESGRSIIEEFYRDISSYAGDLSVDEARLQSTESRLSEIIRAEKKYKTDDAGLLILLNEAKIELARFEESDDLDSLKQKLSQTEVVLKEDAKKLRLAREKAGKRLVEEVQSELGELSMADAKLKVSAKEIPFNESSSEEIEFLISSNKGEDFKPIKNVASGGELSRIMLVLKKVLRDKSGVHVLIFDEVDSGISGGVARAVGAKLKALALESQVICITHLAQVASMADKHLLVEKGVSGKRTLSVVKELNNESQIEEIARMLAGYKITEASRASARELLSSHSSEARGPSL